MSARYHNDTNSSLDPSHVVRALKQVVLSHPALGMRIESKPGEVPRFVRLTSVNISDALKWSEDPEHTLEDATTSELSTPFDTTANRPLWRLLVLRDNTAIFCYHHAIGDGGSGVAFHRAFQKSLNHVAEESDATDMLDLSSQELTLEPPLEKLTDVSVSLKTFWRTMFETFSPSFCQTAHRAWTANPISSAPHCDVNVRLRMIDANIVSALLDLCRQNKCTLTTFLHTLSVMVLSHMVTERFPKELKKRHKTFVTSVAVSLRRFTETSPLSIVDQVSVYNSFQRIQRSFSQYPPTKETFPWTNAAEFHVRLQRKLKKTRQVIGTIGYIYALGMSEKYFLDQLGQHREQTLGLSNLGAMVDDGAGKDGGSHDEKRWKVDDVYFTQCDALLGAAIKMNVVGSPSGSVSIGYTWGRGAINDEVMESFIEEMHDLIVRIVSN